MVIDRQFAGKPQNIFTENVLIDDAEKIIEGFFYLVRKIVPVEQRNDLFIARPFSKLRVSGNNSSQLVTATQQDLGAPDRQCSIAYYETTEFVIICVQMGKKFIRLPRTNQTSGFSFDLSFHVVERHDAPFRPRNRKRPIV